MVDVEITVKCDTCKVKAVIDEFEDFMCIECQEKLMNPKEVIEAMKEAIKRNDEWKTPEIIMSREDMDKPESPAYGIISEYTSESERIMFMRGMKYGMNGVLFSFSDELGLVDEWEKLKW